MKSGTKNYLAISGAVEDLYDNNGMKNMLSASDDFLAQLQAYKDELSEQAENEIDDKAITGMFAKYDVKMMQSEKTVSKSLKNLATKIDKGVSDWDMDTVYEYQLVKDDYKEIVRAIAMDLLYQSHFDESKELLKSSLDIVESDLNILVDHFEKLREILIELENENYQVIFDWIKNFDQDGTIYELSEILQDVVRLMYYQSLETGVPIVDKEIIENTKRVIKANIDSNHNNNQNLGIYELPELGKFNKEAVKEEVKAELIQVFNKLSPETENLQTDSPLHSCLLAGHFALGTLLKYSKRRNSSRRRSTMDNSALKGDKLYMSEHHDDTAIEDKDESTISGSRASSFSTKKRANFNAHSRESANHSLMEPSTRLTVDELPLEIELPSWMSHHALYVCPVTKQPTDKQSYNEPMVLPCGHVLGQQALQRLSDWDNEIKCPYCPKRAFYRDAEVVHFRWM